METLCNISAVPFRRELLLFQHRKLSVTHNATRTTFKALGQMVENYNNGSALQRNMWLFPQCLTHFLIAEFCVSP